MRDPFIAIDAGTNLRSHARALRRSWASALGGAPGTGVRPLIEASWRRTEQAGIDPDHPAPRRAFAPDVLEDYRDSSGLRGCIDVLRTCLRGFAQDAEHIMVVVDADCRILWLEGDLKVRHRADGIAFAEGMDWTEDSVGTNAIGTPWPSTTRCRSSAPSTSPPSSIRGGARTPARRAASSRRARSPRASAMRTMAGDRGGRGSSSRWPAWSFLTCATVARF